MITIHCKCGTVYDVEKGILLQCPNCNEIWDTLPGMMKQQTQQSWKIILDLTVKKGKVVER